MRNDPCALTAVITDIFLWIAGVACTIGTIVLSLVPAEVLAGVSASDKLLHASAYAAITCCFLLAAVWRPGRGNGVFPRSAPIILGCAAGMGVAIEFIQMGFDRHADLRDALADGAGILAVWGVWLAIRRRLA